MTLLLTSYQSELGHTAKSSCKKMMDNKALWVAMCPAKIWDSITKKAGTLIVGIGNTGICYILLILSGLEVLFFSHYFFLFKVINFYKELISECS